MDQQCLRKSYKYQLTPTPDQERELARVVRCGRVLEHAALQPRLTWWRRGQGSSATGFQQEAALQDMRAAFPA